MYNQPDGNYNADLSSGVLTVASDGAISYFASDDGAQNWASWDEGISGNSTVTATAALSLNSLDGTNYGLFDIKDDQRRHNLDRGRVLRDQRRYGGHIHNQGKAGLHR